MTKALLSTTDAGVIFAGYSLVLSAPTHAQVGVEIGPGGVRTFQERPRVEERRVIERRSPGRRVIVEDDDDEVCETRTRRVRERGVWRTRRVTVCE